MDRFDSGWRIDMQKLFKTAERLREQSISVRALPRKSLVVGCEITRARARKAKQTRMNNKSERSTYRLTQMLKRRPTLKMVSVALLGIALVAGTLCVTGFGTKYYRLDGGWVGGSSSYTWSALFAPSDPLGQTAAARPIVKYFNAQFAGLLASFGAENLSDATGEAKMISPDTAEWTLITYMQVAPKQSGGVLQNKGIIVSHGTWKFTSDTSAVLNYTLDIYLPSADSDGDGFPDAGAQPILSVPALDTAKRVPIL